MSPSEVYIHAACEDFLQPPLPALAAEKKKTAKTSKSEKASLLSLQRKLVFMASPLFICDRPQEGCIDFAGRRERSVSMLVVRSCSNLATGS